MSRLLLAAARALLGRWGLPLAGVWVLVAALSSFDPVLGSSTLGSYLAYVALLPMLLLWRLGRLRRERRAQGFPAEERLRDPTGIRAPLAEFGATALLTAAALALASLPLLLPAFELPAGGESLHPVRAAEIEGGWRLEFAAPMPDGAELLLTLAYEEPPPDMRLGLQDAHGPGPQAVAGEVLRWPLHPDDARLGVAEIHPQDDALARAAGVRLLGVLARVAVPRPGVGALPALLGGLLLWFLPLIGLLLALERFGRADGVLAAFAVLLLGALAAFRPDADAPLPDSPLAWIAQGVLALKSVLPDVGGLYAVGHRFELRAGTATWPATATWLLLGALGLALACRRRRPRA